MIFDPDDMPRVESRVVFDGEPCMKALLEKKGWRVFEQRFPRRAFVCIRSDDPPEDPGEYLPFLRSSSEATP